jgi:LPXTG-site transpeptidase (sortase) family protein
MEPFNDLTARLAYQVDRKILHAEEEDHFRMDIPGNERIKAKLLSQAKATTYDPGSPTAAFLRFGVAAILIYMALFALTNASAYSKIIAANVQDFMETRELAAQDAASASAAIDASEALHGVAINAAPDHLEIDGTVTGAGEGIVLPEDGILALDITPTTYYDQLRIPAIDVDTRVVEPTLGLDALMANDWNELEDQIRSSLLQGVVHYPGTAEPGERGNVFLTGHSSNLFWEISSYNTVFALLPKIQVGDDIYITHNQTEYHYRVTETKEVTPQDVSILAQGTDQKMTLMTCTPVGTALKRFVATAKLQN